MNLSWMAWTPHTAVFFSAILLFLIAMSVWEFLSPGGSPRKGVLGLHTTRGDRLFISLLASAFVHLFWLWFFVEMLWIATILCVALAVFVFLKV